MSSPDSGADIPLTPRLAQINADILAEQARRAFVDESIPDRFRLVLPKNAGNPGAEAKPETNTGILSIAKPVATAESPTVAKPAAAAESTPASAVLEPGTLAGDDRFKITLTPFADNNQPFADRISDTVFPGFGRIESTTSKNQWRLDFVDHRRCKTNTKLGVCFTMKLR